MLFLYFLFVIFLKRKIFGFGRLFFFFSDLKIIFELSKKFFVFGKYFISKDVKLGEELSDLELESLRVFRLLLKRRVFLLGMLGLLRSVSVERIFGGRRRSFELLVDFVFF